MQISGLSVTFRGKHLSLQATAKDSQVFLLLTALQSCHRGLRNATGGGGRLGTATLRLALSCGKDLKPARLARGQLLLGGGGQQARSCARFPRGLCAGGSCDARAFRPRLQELQRRCRLRLMPFCLLTCTWLRATAPPLCRRLLTARSPSGTRCVAHPQRVHTAVGHPEVGHAPSRHVSHATSEAAKSCQGAAVPLSHECARSASRASSSPCGCHASRCLSSPQLSSLGAPVGGTAVMRV